MNFSFKIDDLQEVCKKIDDYQGKFKFLQIARPNLLFENLVKKKSDQNLIF